MSSITNNFEVVFTKNILKSDIVKIIEDLNNNDLSVKLDPSLNYGLLFSIDDNKKIKFYIVADNEYKWTPITENTLHEWKHDNTILINENENEDEEMTIYSDHSNPWTRQEFNILKSVFEKYYIQFKNWPYNYQFSNKKIGLPDWGQLDVIEITSGDDFWGLMDELKSDYDELNGRGFWANRRFITNAYKEGRLYGLTVNESGSMYDRNARSDKIFVPDTSYLLPIICVVYKNECQIIWTHPRARKLGLAEYLLSNLDIYKIGEILPEAVGFWEKCGFITILPNKYEKIYFCSE